MAKINFAFQGYLASINLALNRLSHLQLVHANYPNVSVVCGIDGTCTTAESFSALYQHINLQEAQKMLASLTLVWKFVIECQKASQHQMSRVH